IYKEQTEPLLGYYEDSLIKIAGDKDLNAIFEDLEEIVSAKINA
ncbi:adenylate kinase, partial [bacterium]|nr:adenylate kinase [bacterium]